MSTGARSSVGTPAHSPASTLAATIAHTPNAGGLARNRVRRVSATR